MHPDLAFIEFPPPTAARQIWGKNYNQNTRIGVSTKRLNLKTMYGVLQLFEMYCN